MENAEELEKITDKPAKRESEVSLDGVTIREVSKLEHLIGPDIYKLLIGLIKNPLSITGIIILAIFALIAIFAPVLAPPVGSDPYQMPNDGYSSVPRPPGSTWDSRPPEEIPFWYEAVTGETEWVHIFGTAEGQWDIYYGMVWGTRVAFKAGIIITVSVVLIGVFIGGSAAFYGKAVDSILMRIVDLFMAFPFLVAAITAATILTPIMGRSITPIIVALIIFGWTGYARVIRGDILSVRERDFILAARVIGAKNNRILFRHVVPNAIYPTLVLASMDIGSYVLTFSALSFLGVGPQVGYADWGQLIAFGRNWIPDLDEFSHVISYPGIAIVLFVLAWNLIGDAVRDLFDPRMRGTK